MLQMFNALTVGIGDITALIVISPHVKVEKCTLCLLVYLTGLMILVQRLRERTSQALAVLPEQLLKKKGKVKW